jgi:hypothetical protein
MSEMLVVLRSGRVRQLQLQLKAGCVTGLKPFKGLVVSIRVQLSGRPM